MPDDQLRAIFAEVRLFCYHAIEYWHGFICFVSPIECTVTLDAFSIPHLQPFATLPVPQQAIVVVEVDEEVCVVFWRLGFAIHVDIAFVFSVGEKVFLHFFLFSWFAIHIRIPLSLLHQMDVDGDGLLSAEDLTVALDNLGLPFDAASLMEKMDSTGSGVRMVYWLGVGW